MIYQQPKNTLKSGQLILIAGRMLASINSNIVSHNERTAYIAMEIARHYKMNHKCSLRNLVLLALLHTLGFFREDFFFQNNPHEHTLNYFSIDKETACKYIFGCYYLNFMTPLGKDALALEDFNLPFNEDLKKYIYQTEYRSIIYLSARISDFLLNNPDKKLPSKIIELAPGFIDPELADFFDSYNKNGLIEKGISDNSYKNKLRNYVAKIKFPAEQNEQLRKLLIYFLDFKSTSTLKHAINTSCYALSLGQRMNFSKKELTVLYESAILHDIGKIATPQRILEFPGKLSPEDMGIMRYHVKHSRRILNGLVPEVTLEAVSRHHEKLNGKGYPNHISEKDITLLQRALTVADITSALNDTRSYKEGFSKERTLEILKSMTDNGELDKNVSDIIINDFDSILEELPKLQKFLSVDFKHVIERYNDFVLSDFSLEEAAKEDSEDELIETLE